MLKDNVPIYPLGSVQDQALQGFMRKENFVEAHKFETSMYIMMLSSVLSSHKNPNELLDIISEKIADATQLMMFEEESLIDRKIAKEERKQAMQQMVEKMNKV